MISEPIDFESYAYHQDKVTKLSDKSLKASKPLESRTVVVMDVSNTIVFPVYVPNVSFKH